VEGSAALPAGLDLAAFRIVQEALTNALKHAPGQQADVTVGYHASALELEITNTMASGNGAGHAGHGLVGMRERALLYGGVADAGPDDRGRFVVRARLPLDAST
jgi:signal transduction histidine kinase